MKKKKYWKIATGAVCAAALVLFSSSRTLADNNNSNILTDIRTGLANLINLNYSNVLADIRTFTYHTAQYAKEINTSLTLALVYLNEWLITPDATDPNDPTGTIQSHFANYTNTILTTNATNNTLQASLTTDFLGPDVTPTSAPFTNDVTFQTLLGSPYFNPDPRQGSADPARNYIFNAAGLNIKHMVPRDDWKGSDQDKQKYRDFYKTISAIQTFNSYVLGELYADYKSGGAASSQQTSLIQQASSSTWFSVVASEHIGLVLRQILMYNSQLLVVATQILQVQKEILAGQAMSNTLVVLGNQFNEKLLLNNAISSTPGQ